MDDSGPKYKVGALVKCSYDFYDFYSYFYDEDDYPYLPFYGIVVDLAWDQTWHNMEAVYKVYCFDGYYRFFLEDEIHQV
jgi:hypothetical protein